MTTRTVIVVLVTGAAVFGGAVVAAGPATARSAGCTAAAPADRAQSPPAWVSQQTSCVDGVAVG